MTNRIVIVLISLAILMQGALFYRQYRQQPSQARPESIRDADPDTFLDLDSIPTKGASSAAVVLAEFSDYECPFCQKHSKDVGPKLEEEFLKTGKVRHAFFNNPLPIHSSATLLATAAVCAGKQGHFWEMHEQLFVKKPSTREEINSIAIGLSLDLKVLDGCMAGTEAAKAIERDVNTASSLALQNTPGFAIGTVDRNGRLRIQKFVIGAMPYSTFEKIINELIAKGA